MKKVFEVFAITFIMLLIISVYKTPVKADNLNKIAMFKPVSSDDWSEEVNKALQMLSKLNNTGSVLIYEEIERYVSQANMNEFDKKYIVEQLEVLGKKLVYTDDYLAAVDALKKSRTRVDEESLNNSAVLITQVHNDINREYLLSEQKKVYKAFDEKTLQTGNSLKELKVNSKLTKDDKVKLLAKIIEDSGIIVPKDYIKDENGYIVLDILMSETRGDYFNKPEQIRTNIVDSIALCEENKIFGVIKISSVADIVRIAPNRGSSDIDITEKLIIYKRELLKETYCKVLEATGVSNDSQCPYVYVKDGRVYLRPIPYDVKEYSGKLFFQISYRSSGIISNIAFKISE